MTKLISVLAVVLNISTLVSSKINRKQVISRFNPKRDSSSNSTPIQVGNGNFAFGADITGLQTFLPYNILSSWGWHNFSLPTTPGQTSPADFTGLDWWTHGRLVNYDQPNLAENDISNWLIENPQRINLGRIGFWFGGGNVTEIDLSEKSQSLDLYSGTLTSQFLFQSKQVQVRTYADPESSTVAFQIESDLISTGQLGIFFDYPYPDVNKFDAPFVGVFNNVSLHTTSLQQNGQQAQITHNMDTTTYFTSIAWEGEASISGPLTGTHRYVLQPSSSRSGRLEFTTSFSPTSPRACSDASAIAASSVTWWSEYWESGAFIDMTATQNSNATELQRRTVLSQYLLAVNEAGHDSPQESGLVNNGWYGKFHMEMFWWHRALGTLG